MSDEIKVQLAPEDEETLTPNEEKLKAKGVVSIIWEKTTYTVTKVDGTVSHYSSDIAKASGFLVSKVKEAVKEAVSKVAEKEEEKAPAEAPAPEAAPEASAAEESHPEAEKEADSVPVEPVAPEAPVSPKEEPLPEEKEEPKEEAKPEPEPIPVEDPNYEPLEEQPIEDKELLRGFDWVLEKENEDAIPFRDEELTVVCDGMGGTGSAKVTIPGDCQEEFAASAWVFMDGLKNDAKLADFCEKIIEDIFKLSNGKAITASNATFASRIICARFAYMKRHSFLDLSPLFHTHEEEGKEGKKFVDSIDYKLSKKKANYLPSFAEADLSDKEYLEKAAMFITYGLAHVSAAFNIGPYTMANLAVLPATLAATYTHEVNGKRVTDVIWAGDSRCYAFLKGKGIQVINKDDENKQTHIMNNFFCVDRLASLHHAHYEDLPEDMIVFSCSDGTFDPFPYYDSVAIASIFSELIREDAENEMTKEKWEAFGLRIQDKYKNNFRIDDISISLNVYGYENAKLGKDFDLIDDETEALFKEAHAKRDILDYLDKRSNGIEVTDGYIAQRSPIVVEGRPEWIAKLFFMDGPRDIALSDELYEFLSPYIPVPRDDLDAIAAKCLECINSLKEEHDFRTLLQILVPSDGNFVYQKVKALEEAIEKLDEAMKKQIEIEYNNIDDFEKAMADLQSIQEERTELYHLYREAEDNLDSELLKSSRDHTIIRSLVTALTDKIRESIPQIDVSQEQKMEALKKAIAENREKVAKLVTAALESRPTEKSSLDAVYNASLLEKCRRTLSLALTWEKEKSFYAGLAAKQEASTEVLNAHYIEEQPAE